MKLATPSRLAIATVVAAILAVPGPAAAKRGLPPGLLMPNRGMEHVKKFEVPAVDVRQSLDEDAARLRSGVPAPTRFAVPAETAITIENAGTWETLADGSSLWRLRIASGGARNLNLGLDRFDLPSGATFWLYDAAGATVQGPYTSDDRNALGGLWTAVVPGDEIVVELHLPRGEPDDAALRIASVNRGYRDFGPRPDVGETKQGLCNIDVICPEGDPWRDQIRSVARIVINGQYLCSGQLVNNTAEDGTPYFLTAQHCVENAFQATAVVAYWNFESPTCGALSGGTLTQNQSGATLVALWELETGSDFTLIRLDEMPDPFFNVYYAGWDATGDIPPGAVGIHHPSGDEKAISFDDDPLLKVNAYGYGSYQWRIGQWELGTTEGGSSGSCIFDPVSGLCVGTLTGGIASCSNPSGYDTYGRMDAHWTGNGSPSGRLEDWLDPLDTGVLTLEGMDSGFGGGETWLVPAAASAPGVGTSNWKTQLVIANPNEEARQARIFFVPSGEPWPGSQLSGPHPIPAGGSFSIDDPLAALNPTTGLLYVTVDGAGTPVSTRTYNLSDDGGTFGQGIPAILLNDAELVQSYTLPFLLSDPVRFRANLGIVQTSAGIMAVRVQVHAPDGTVLATKGYSSTSGFLQINNLLDSMGIGNTVVEGGWISVRLTGGSPAYWTCYASIVDGSTDDPTYVLPVAAP